MRAVVLLLSVLALVVVGCGDSSDGGGGGGEGGGGPSDVFTWPPNATVHFDEYGILNADCATDEDCAMVLGYYHAFERFVQMDVRRRFSTGRLADLLPKLLAEALNVPDVAADTRALFSTRDGQPVEEFLIEQASDQTLAVLRAYSVGVNQWIADVRNGENGATFPRELANPPLAYSIDDVPEWTPQDSLATVLALADSLTNDEGPQVNAGLARAAIGDDDKFADLWSVRPLKESAILPGFQPPAAQAALQPKREAARTSVAPERSEAALQARLQRRARAIPALQRLQNRLQRTQQFRELALGSREIGVETGSNNWVIAPELTTGGNPLLSDDPHLAMTQPATWYIAHLDAKTNGTGSTHVAGVTFAGLPVPLIGQNEDLAWGVTTTVLDFSDVYIEELVTDGQGNPTGVMFQGEEVPFIRRTFTVSFNDGTTTDRELLFVPHHGAVREIDVDNGTAITLRWTGNDITTDLEAFAGLGRATNMEEAQEAIALITTSGQNFVVADRDGNIGWFPYNRLPKCTWATNLEGVAARWLPLDGTGDFEWTQFFELDELPQALNPENGYIATANNDMTGALFDGDPTNEFEAPYQSEAAAGYRHGQIVNLIEAVGDQHDRSTMDAIVSDIYSLIGEEMTPGILTIANDDQTNLTDEAQQVVSALTAWDFSCPTGLDGTNADMSPPTSDSDVLLSSSGCVAFHALLNELRARVEENEFAASFYSPSSRRPSNAFFYSITDPSQLIAGDIYWDNPGTQEVETKYEVMGDALDTVGNFLVSELGNDETSWPWGRLHGMILESDLSAFGVVQYNNPPPDEPLFAQDGGLFTVDVANPDPQDLIQRAGPSTRFVCEVFPSGPQCSIQLPGGQSGDIDSPNYEDLLPKWLANEPIDLVFDIAEAEANAVRTVNFNE